MIEENVLSFWKKLLTPSRPVSWQIRFAYLQTRSIRCNTEVFKLVISL
jgi:hypothetical protein